MPKGKRHGMFINNFLKYLSKHAAKEVVQDPLHLMELGAGKFTRLTKVVVTR